jgi:hypothetical protein
LAEPHKTTLLCGFSEITSHQQRKEAGVTIHLKYTMGQKEQLKITFIRNKEIGLC